MKVKSLLLLILIRINLITAESTLEKNNCDDWFPEPISFKTETYNANLTEQFKIIDDILSDRDFNKTKGIVEEYVIEILNQDSSGGYFDIVRIVFKQLPTLRQFTISILCLIVSLILFPFIWKLGLDEFIEFFGIQLQIHRYRVGLAIVPIFCCIGLMLLTSNLSTSASFVIKGLNELETGNDRSFMPIKERIAKKLSTIACIFKRDFVNRFDETWEIVERYFEFADGIELFGKNLKQIEQPQKRVEKCYELALTGYETVQRIRNEFVIQDILRDSQRMNIHYRRIIDNGLNISIPIYGKALGGIEEFVERYHRTVLLIPSVGLVEFYQSIIAVTVAVTVFLTASLTVLMIIGHEFKKKWIQNCIDASVPLMSFFAILSLVLFLALVFRICFIVLVHEQAERNQFETLRMVKPTRLEENGYNYSINYGLILQRSSTAQTTLFNLMTEDVNAVAECIKAEKLFKPNKIFNDVVKELAKSTVDKYENYVSELCKKLKDFKKSFSVKVANSCDYSVSILENITQVETEVCNAATRLKTHPINKTNILETALSKWTQAIQPNPGMAVISMKSVRDERSPMQMYMVFENPSKKLRPTILEHLFRMATLVAKLVPIYVVLSVFLMCIIPLLMEDEEKKTLSKESKSMMKSSSNEKTKSLSNEDQSKV